MEFGPLLVSIPFKRESVSEQHRQVLRFPGPPKVSIPFKRESVSELFIDELLKEKEVKRFNSLQTGKRI